MLNYLPSSGSGAVKINKFTASMDKIRKRLIILFCAIFGLTGILFVNYYIIGQLSGRFIFNSFADLPQYEYVLVFGAGRMYPSDNPNYAYAGRMNAVEKLGKMRSVKKIILSGRNEKPHYNETEVMKSELITRGLNQQMLIVDSLGSNTFQSLENYKRKYGKNGVILVSQKEHLERALFYAKRMQINAVGYNAERSGINRFSFRELLARINALWTLMFR
jgi:SanA protein